MNELVTQNEEIKLYYSGFDAIARYVPEKNHWECVVLNSADPIDFRIPEKDNLQGTLKEYILNYYEYCKHMGKFARKSIS